MAEILNPTGMMMSGGDGGLFGGNGLIGGLILGSLLRNNGNLFGNDGAGNAAAGALLRSPPEQSQANMDLMAAVGAVDKAVAVSTAAMEASQAQQSAAITGQLNNVAGSLAARVDGVKDVINGNTVGLMNMLNGVDKSVAASTTTLLQNINEVDRNVLTAQNVITQSISADGDKTRALLVQQYEAALNRQITDANSRIVALENQRNLEGIQRGIEINTTNNINQMQQQQQQQAQYGQLYNAIWGLAQSIRSTNEAINVGSGTLTANPANTNTNIR
jgi:hypothetical protein